MKRLLLLFTWFALMPCLSMANEILFLNGNKTPNDPLQPTTLETGSVTLNISNQSNPSIALSEYPADDMKSNFFVKVAEASVIPPDTIMRDFLKAQQKIQTAKSLNDVEGSATANFIQPLKDKVSAGADEMIVMSMLQTLRPESVQIRDVRSYKDQSKLAVTGVSRFGPMQGVVEMIEVNGGWKIERETWYCDQKPKVVIEKELLSAMSIPEPIDEPLKSSTLKILDTPDYKLNRNWLNLTRAARPPIRKREFTFIYFIHKKDHLKEHLTGVQEKVPAPLHIMWTGPRAVVPNQMVKNDYPINYSIADDGDGFMPGALNLHLPKKRPNGVVVSAMFTF